MGGLAWVLPVPELCRGSLDCLFFLYCPEGPASSAVATQGTAYEGEWRPPSREDQALSNFWDSQYIKR